MSHRIALIDDDRTQLAIWTDRLVEEGYQVLGFRRAEDALSALWDEPVDLVLTDLFLPGMNGVDLARELRQRPWAQKVPILGMSALEFIEHQAVTSGALDRVFHKTRPAEDILAAVFCAIERAGDPVEVPPRSLFALPTEESAQQTAQVEVELPASPEYVAEYTENLSYGGLFVRTWNPLPVGTPIEVVLKLPFLGASLQLQGRVTRTVAVDSAGARTGDAGMGIGLLDVPKHIRLAMDAFVAGLRAGTFTQPAPSPVRLVLCVGFPGELPRDVVAIIRRAGIRSVRAPRPAEAMLIVEQRKPRLVLVDPSVLESYPALLAELQQSNAAVVVVVQGAPPPNLPPEVPILDLSGPPEHVDALLSEHLGLGTRASARIRCPAPVRCQRPGGRLEATLEDLSLNGLSMRTADACAIGERLKVAMELPDSGGAIEGHVRTVRVTRIPEDPCALRVGAFFERLENDSTEVLRRFFADRQALQPYLRHLERTLVARPGPTEPEKDEG